MQIDLLYRITKKVSKNWNVGCKSISNECSLERHAMAVEICVSKITHFPYSDKEEVWDFLCALLLQELFKKHNMYYKTLKKHLQFQNNF